MDRFSLLLLEPGEIYFEDFSVTLYRNPDQKQRPKSSDENQTKRRGRKPFVFRTPSEGGIPDGEAGVPGRLKICSKSLVFVPAVGDGQRPLIKFPLNECQNIEGDNYILIKVFKCQIIG